MATVYRKIKLRRGLTADMSTVVFTQGEPAVYLDALPGAALFVIGDGATPGGIPVGFISPLTQRGGLMVSNDSDGTVIELAPGTDGHVLKLLSGMPTWMPDTGGFDNPMTTEGDIIIGTTAGDAIRLARGTNGQILELVAGRPAWQDKSGGFSNPMTTEGDIIIGSTDGDAIRLSKGTVHQILRMYAGRPTWIDDTALLAEPEFVAATPPESNNWNSVAFGNGIFVAVASNGSNRVAISADGRNWISAATMTSYGWTHIVFADGVFVMAGDSNYIAYSKDGKNWTTVNTGRHSQYLFYANGVLLSMAYSTSDHTYSLDRGKTWNNGSFTYPSAEHQTWANGTFVGVGYGGGFSQRVASSTTGIGSWSYNSMPHTGPWGGIAYGKGVVVAIATNNTPSMVYSTNYHLGAASMTWNSITPPNGDKYHAIHYANGMFVAVKETGGTSTEGAYSFDGINWTAIVLPAGGWKDIAYGNGVWVLVGGSGTNRLAYWGAMAKEAYAEHAADVDEFVNPMTTGGDIIIADTGGTPIRLAKGTANQILKMVSNQPAWADDSGGSGGGGKTLDRWKPTDNQPPSSNYATIDSRNTIPVLDFDASTEEAAVFQGIIPHGADLSSGLDVIIHWLATSATSGGVVWGAAFERMNTDLDSDSFATGVNSATSTANATNGIISSVTITLSSTEIDGLTAGDPFRLKISRKVGEAGDDMTGDAELLAVELRQVA